MTGWVRVRRGQHAGMVGYRVGIERGILSDVQLGDGRVVQVPVPDLEKVPAGTPSTPRPAAFCPDCDGVHAAGECALVDLPRDPLWLRVAAWILARWSR